MISWQQVGATELIERLGAAPGKIRTRAASALDTWATELAGYIKASKLSGQVLNRRSGRLSSSVHPIATGGSSASTISAGAGGGAGVPYAKIHEYGGTIPAHEVVVQNAQALAFTVAGVLRFAKSVSIPDVVMPERSYMRSGLQDKRPEGVAALRAAVKEGIAA